MITRKVNAKEHYYATINDVDLFFFSRIAGLVE